MSYVGEFAGWNILDWDHFNSKWHLQKKFEIPTTKISFALDFIKFLPNCAFVLFDSHINWSVTNFPFFLVSIFFGDDIWALKYRVGLSKQYGLMLKNGVDPFFFDNPNPIWVEFRNHLAKCIKIPNFFLKYQ